MKILLLLFSLLILCLQSNAQQKEYVLKFTGIRDKGKDIRTFNLKKADSTLILKHIDEQFRELYSQGYLEAEVDSILIDSTMAYAHFIRGRKYYIEEILNPNGSAITKDVARSSKSKILKPESFEILCNKLLEFYENNGYPFVVVSVDSMKFDNGKVKGIFRIDSGPKIVCNKTILKGDALISDNYIQRFTGIIPGENYSESTIREAAQRINEIPFLREIKPSDIIFREESYDYYFYLNPSRSNSLNGIIGILPDENNQGKVLITGDVDLMLMNSFKRGEVLSLKWKKSDALSQRFRADVSFPYLLKSPFGFEGSFDLLKKDTSYLTMNGRAGIMYFTQGFNYIKLFLHSTKSMAISEVTSDEYPDFSLISTGTGINLQQFDYVYNPRKGYRINTELKAGRKQTEKKNPEDSLALITSENQWDMNFYGEIYLPVMSKSTFHIMSKSGYLNGKNLFTNEMFLLGGFSSIRGFDEESVPATAFSILTLEYRYLFEKNSNIFLFADGCWYEKKSAENYVHDVPIGAGAGFTIQTKAGIFSISYAVGKQFKNPVSLRSSKVHFGYVNRF